MSGERDAVIKGEGEGAASIAAGECLVCFKNLGARERALSLSWEWSAGFAH